MNKRLENIKNLIETDANCMVEEGEDCQMCGECLPKPDEDMDLEDEARQNYIRDAYDWGR